VALTGDGQALTAKMGVRRQAKRRERIAGVYARNVAATDKIPALRLTTDGPGGYPEGASAAAWRTL